MFSATASDGLSHKAGPFVDLLGKLESQYAWTGSHDSLATSPVRELPRPEASMVNMRTISERKYVIYARTTFGKHQDVSCKISDCDITLREHKNARKGRIDGNICLYQI